MPTLRTAAVMAGTRFYYDHVARQACGQDGRLANNHRGEEQIMPAHIHPPSVPISSILASGAIPPCVRVHPGSGCALHEQQHRYDRRRQKTWGRASDTGGHMGAHEVERAAMWVGP